jgi:hypothetical protein
VLAKLLSERGEHMDEGEDEDEDADDDHRLVRFLLGARMVRRRRGRRAMLAKLLSERGEDDDDSDEDENEGLSRLGKAAVLGAARRRKRTRAAALAKVLGEQYA